MTAHYEYAFPAIRGVQAERVFFVSMCPLKLLSKMFVWDDDDLPTELRAQRTLNKGRIPEIVRYIERNPSNYTFSAITASVDASIRFVPYDGAAHGAATGVLYIPMDGRFVINDGQHRRAAIEQALKTHPELGDESIAVVFFIDKGLERCQQMFADLNRHAVRASKSIGVLYDHRDPLAALTRVVALSSHVFRGFVEMEATSLPKESRRLFTLSAIYGAHKALFDGISDLDDELQTKLAMAFWEIVDTQFPEWQDVRQKRMRSPEVRADLIHSHSIVLTALGRIGNSLLHSSKNPDDWRPTLEKLCSLDWSRANSRLWGGRALIGGRVSKAVNNVLLTTAAIRTHLDLPLPPDEQRAEDAYRKEH
ncbi:DNA sulfur modification protein DndB [Nonomuraea turkmeniaca]|uniref:DNA sulfur modification protein DndB n=1 Tax=Nonomuraea turkmeniaca TaxID=103838 RepID=A0A5S4FPM2_9ACTN|nr:DNA sulfur modification protein DndB [Nonomuraea turkmeniaca]